jgi:phage terminase large subunit
VAEREIVIPYNPRPPQLEIHKAMESSRFVVVVAHRRMGKTVSAINQLIKSAIECNRERPRFAYIAPTYSQAKRVAWDYLLHYTRPLNAEANIAEMRVDFWDRRIQLYGSDNPDSLRGQYFDGVILDEIADQNPKIWNEIVRPALADRAPQSWAMFIGTPKGQNHFKDLRDRAEVEPNWKMLEFKASQTKLVLESELQAAKREMGDDKYDQEFECSFSASVEGSYYGKILNGLEADGRYHKIERDDLCKTFVAWDLGMGDSTSIWVAQLANNEVRLMDYIENHGQGLDWYVRELTNRGWHKAPQLLPHDVQVRELGTGKSRLEVLQEAGLDCTVVGRLGVDDGIQAVRRLLPRCYFNVPQVKQGLDCLRNYRREFDEKRQVFFDKPLHDWSSHGSDAFRYLAVGMDERGSGWGKPLKVNTSWVV